MPVRIYDIAKKLGLENKDVLTKAKALGITAAKVPSSSLDKITAEFLENELSGGKPPVAAQPAQPPPSEKIILVKAPPPEPVAPPQPPPVQVPEPVVLAPVAELPHVIEPPAAPHVPEPLIPVEAHSPASATAHVAPPVQAAPALPPPPLPVAPPQPPTPQVGDKVGFIQLPVKPQPRQPEQRPGQNKGAPSRPAQPPQAQQRGGRQDFGRGPSDNRNFRGGPPNQQGRQPGFAPRPQQQQGDPRNAPPRAPAAPKILLPESAQTIIMKPPIVVRELAEQLKRKPFQIIADLMEVGVFANVNQPIEEEIAKKVCAKHGYRFEVEKRQAGKGSHAPVKKDVSDDADQDKPEDLKPRAPVVTIMGHVDHGKTTLLDVIRKSNVVAGEAGGITQHIGAYTIAFPHPERKNEIQLITFLDTPGHAAFSSMRARGANVTDIVVLVVAANDGVMPQTLEALSHAQAAKATIIVAVNKCDHPNANPMKVRQQLQDKGLVCEEWGGQTLFVDCSGLTKQGVDKLLEAILLQAEIMELKANPDRRAKGNVIESGLEPGGPTATVLVRKGTLKLGEIVICGQYYGKVRALINEENKRLKEAGPSVAVKLLGLNGVPEAGLEFNVVEDEKQVREIAEQREMEARALGQEARAKVTLENLFATMSSTNAKTLKVVVKADTQGSVEAIVEALKKIESDKVSLELIHSAVGTITESDVALASASHAVILGFHTRIDNGVSDVAKREGVQIKLYAIIYELIDQVKEALSGLLDPILKDIVVGSAEVRQIFELSKGTPVAGCMVTTGRIIRGKVRVMRRKNLIYEGVTQTLRRFQDEVNEVRAGLECGIRVEGFGEFQVGDTIECYSVERIAQKL
jgi:translation initiation factor IF-2